MPPKQVQKAPRSQFTPSKEVTDVLKELAAQHLLADGRTKGYIESILRRLLERSGPTAVKPEGRKAPAAGGQKGADPNSIRNRMKNSNEQKVINDLKVEIEEKRTRMKVSKLDPTDSLMEDLAAANKNLGELRRKFKDLDLEEKKLKSANLVDGVVDGITNLQKKVFIPSSVNAPTGNKNTPSTSSTRRGGN